MNDHHSEQRGPNIVRPYSLTSGRTRPAVSSRSKR